MNHRGAVLGKRGGQRIGRVGELLGQLQEYLVARDGPEGPAFRQVAFQDRSPADILDLHALGVDLHLA